MGCKNYCLYGQNACCLECQIKDQCNIQCDDKDSYEYAVDCPDYVEEEEMKNKEKFAKEIVEIVFDGSDIAVDKATGKPVHCENIGCPDCMFNEKICSTALKKWAESEYIGKQVISKRDRAFLEYLKEEYRYIARDDNGDLFAYIVKPNKNEVFTCWGSGRANCTINRYFNIDFPMVKWSDSEPWLIEDLKKLEVVEDYE